MDGKASMSAPLLGAKKEPSNPLRKALNVILLAWEFQESDIPTFIIPNTLFGIMGALSGTLLTLVTGPGAGVLESTGALQSQPPPPTAPAEIPWLAIIARFPLVFLFNFLNNLVFTLSNQTAPMAVEEDKINKPWRPIPSGRITSEQARRAMLVLIPVVLAFNYAMGTLNEAMGIFVLTWMYNDLGGGDELSRDAIIAIAFALFNGGSLRLAIPSPSESLLGDMPSGNPSPYHYEISSRGYTWLAIISGAVWTTMQVQDLKDQEGDRLRGRKTIPLLFGERFSRCMIALFVAAWSVACVVFWAAGMVSASPANKLGAAALGFVVPLGMGGYVAFRALALRGKPADARTWRLWCAWLVGLYILPVLAKLN